MSYLGRGPMFILLGIATLPLFFLGTLLILYGIGILVTGLRKEQPGLHPDRCSSMGHDWRGNLPNYHPGEKRCRNCMSRKGDPGPMDSGYFSTAPYAPPPYPGPPAYPGYSYPGPPPAGGGVAPQFFYAAPAAGRRCPWCATLARPEQSVCPGCGRVLV